MALSAAGRAEQQQVGAFLEPAVTGGERHDLGLGDHRHGVEVEGVEGLARQQAGLGEMALDAAAVAFGQFVFGEGGEEAGGGPAFLVGLFGELRATCSLMAGRRSSLSSRLSLAASMAVLVFMPQLSRQARRSGMS